MNATQQPQVFRCAICGNDLYGIKHPIGRFDFEGEGTCKTCYDELVVPCDKFPDNNTPVYSPLGVGMRVKDTGMTTLISNERWNYKIKCVSVSHNTRPIEKLLNEYNTELETIATEMGLNIKDEKIDTLIVGKIQKIIDLLEKRQENLPKSIRMNDKNIAFYKKQLLETTA